MKYIYVYKCRNVVHICRAYHISRLDRKMNVVTFEFFAILYFTLVAFTQTWEQFSTKNIFRCSTEHTLKCRNSLWILGCCRIKFQGSRLIKFPKLLFLNFSDGNFSSKFILCILGTMISFRKWIHFLFFSFFFLLFSKRIIVTQAKIEIRLKRYRTFNKLQNFKLLVSKLDIRLISNNILSG